MPKVDRYKNKKLKNSNISAGVWVEHADKANVATIGSGLYYKSEFAKKIVIRFKLVLPTTV